MARHVIRYASGGEIRVVGDAALPFFPGWVILDTLDDGQPATTYYDAATADFRYVNITELGDPASPASVALKAALVPFWAPNEVVAQDAVRMTALGLTIKRNTAGTTRASYDATEQAAWTVVSAGGGGSAPDATASVKGIVQLAGDLGGTAASPTVPGLASKRGIGDRGNRRTFALLGDSLSGNNGAAGTVASPAVVPNHLVLSNGYWTWTAMRLKGRALLNWNFGVGGNTTTQILARVGDVIAADPGHCIIQGYSNDPSNGITTATTISNLIAICDALRAGGVTPVLCAAVPKNVTPIPPGQINRALYEYARTTPGVVFCDWYPYIADPATGQWAAGMSDDGIHPNAGGASRMGRALAAVLDPLLGATPPLYGSNVDNLNKLSNGTFNGGTTLATNWTSRMGANTTASKVARTDGIQGTWQQLVVGAGGTVGSGDIYATWSATVGDVMQAAVEFQIDPGATGVTDFGLRIADGSGANEQMIVNVNDTTSGIGTGTVDFPTSGVLLSPPFRTAAASGFFLLKFACATGTIRWGRASLVKVG